MPAYLSVRVPKRTTENAKGVGAELAKTGSRRLLIVVIHAYTRRTRSLLVDERRLQFLSVAGGTPRFVLLTVGEVCLLAVEAADVHCEHIAVDASYCR
jgi:hypothetical protein